MFRWLFSLPLIRYYELVSIVAISVFANKISSEDIQVNLQKPDWLLTYKLVALCIISILLSLLHSDLVKLRSKASEQTAVGKDTYDQYMALLPYFEPQLSKKVAAIGAIIGIWGVLALIV
jgi:hypothetical protein